MGNILIHIDKNYANITEEKLFSAIEATKKWNMRQSNEAEEKLHVTADQYISKAPNVNFAELMKGSAEGTKTIADRATELLTSLVVGLQKKGHNIIIAPLSDHPIKVSDNIGLVIAFQSSSDLFEEYVKQDKGKFRTHSECLLPLSKTDQLLRENSPQTHKLLKDNMPEIAHSPVFMPCSLLGIGNNRPKKVSDQLSRFAGTNIFSGTLVQDIVFFDNTIRQGQKNHTNVLVAEMIDQFSKLHIFDSTEHSRKQDGGPGLNRQGIDLLTTSSVSPLRKPGEQGTSGITNAAKRKEGTYPDIQQKKPYRK